MPMVVCIQIIKIKLYQFRQIYPPYGIVIHFVHTTHKYASYWWYATVKWGCIFKRTWNIL